MKTDCLAANHNLILESTGEVKLCCNSSMALDYESGLVDTAIVGKLATEIQTALAAGVPHKNCTRCWEEQQDGGRSYRYSYNDMYPEYRLLNDRSIKTIHVQYENTCNLTCVYCGPQFSSKWAELRHMKQGFRNPITFSDTMLATLEMVTLAGGEPSLIKTNVELLDRLLVVNPKCQVIINTNLSMGKGNPVFERLVKFRSATVIVSFEAIEQQYEYIRQGAKWTDFINNLHWISTQVERVQTSMILFPLSINTITDAIELSLQYVSPGDVYINNYHGSQLAWNNVDSSILSKLRSNLVEYAAKFDPAIQNQILSMSDLIMSTRSGTYFPFLDHYDQLIKSDHRTIFTELYN
jgi:organic radical activating enzyme